MIELGLVIAIGSLLVLPALAVSGRQLAARWQAQREAARARLELARERQEAAGQAERDRIQAFMARAENFIGATNAEVPTIPIPSKAPCKCFRPK